MDTITSLVRTIIPFFLPDRQGFVCLSLYIRPLSGKRDFSSLPPMEKYLVVWILERNASNGGLRSAAGKMKNTEYRCRDFSLPTPRVNFFAQREYNYKTTNAVSTETRERNRHGRVNFGNVQAGKWNSNIHVPQREKEREKERERGILFQTRSIKILFRISLETDW